MIKNCPDCIRVPMLLFDQEGQNQVYSAIGAGYLQSGRPEDPVIDRAYWPWAGSPPPNTWACPRCGHHESVGPDVEAQQEFRPRLF